MTRLNIARDEITTIIRTRLDTELPGPCGDAVPPDDFENNIPYAVLYPLNPSEISGTMVDPERHVTYEYQVSSSGWDRLGAENTGERARRALCDETWWATDPFSGISTPVTLLAVWTRPTGEVQLDPETVKPRLFTHIGLYGFQMVGT